VLWDVRDDPLRQVVKVTGFIFLIGKTEMEDKCSEMLYCTETSQAMGSGSSIAFLSTCLKY